MVGLPVLALWFRKERRRANSTAPQHRRQPAAYTVILNPDRNETIFLPLQSTAGQTVTVAAAPPPSSPTAEEALEPLWQQRLLTAEKRAEELLEMVRAGLAPQLARHLMNRLVQELIAQRGCLLQTQQMATRQLATLEARFTAVLQQAQEQLQAHEKRALELEEKLAAKSQETSALLDAIVVIQKKLESTQSGNSGSWT
jgi:hypothetical protein